MPLYRVVKHALSYFKPTFFLTKNVGNSCPETGFFWGRQKSGNKCLICFGWNRCRETVIWIWFQETGVRKQVSWFLLESGVRKQVSCFLLETGVRKHVSRFLLETGVGKQVSGFLVELSYQNLYRSHIFMLLFFCLSSYLLGYPFFQNKHKRKNQ